MSLYSFLFALSGPLLWAISTHLDKYLLDQYFKDIHPAVSLAFTGLVNVAALPIFLLIDPRILNVDLRTAAVMTLSGGMLMSAILFYLMALKYNEASVVAPFFQASPLFGMALAFGVLGEQLTGMQLLGSLLTIAGALVVATVGAGRPHHGLAALMLLCAAMAALSSLIFKIFSVAGNFWPTTFWMFFGEAIFGCCLLFVGTFRRELVQMVRANARAVVGINLVNETVNLLGSLGMRYALMIAPLSIVQAISSTTSVFVFIIGVALSLIAPQWGREDLSRPELERKAAAAGLVGVGVTLIGL
ncbi:MULTISPECIES: EamA family transporter [unclassified Hyphomicrobium]|uniref:EamA family transporter n=1 Tax=unclassified Hyphomicrobium TaxID=2619925 RepID=UPI000213F67E|nr:MULTISPECIES: DMT family transporter [unclassified Hyphomicrobium]CCB64939.1 conserved membrane protein of unknown function [Hyphomicrobium sp. MC1]